MMQKDMITKFSVRRVVWQTPFGQFDNKQEAEDRVTKVDMLPELVVSRVVECAEIRHLLKEINVHCESIGLEPNEYKLTLSGNRTEVPATVPENFWHLIAFAIEGGSEGWYIHIGAIVRSERRDQPPSYIDFGFSKTFDHDNAFALAREYQRFLDATLWN